MYRVRTDTQPCTADSVLTIIQLYFRILSDLSLEEMTVLFNQFDAIVKHFAGFLRFRHCLYFLFLLKDLMRTHPNVLKVKIKNDKDV